MRPRIVIRPAADAELDEQAAYIAQGSPDAAWRFLQATQTTFDELTQMPEMGRLWNSRHERLAGVRVWRVKGFENWLIFYRPTDDGIEIMHILHGARDLSPLLEPED